MHACVLRIQGVLRVADELIVEIWLPPKIHTDISRRKISRPHLKLHGIALLQYGGESVARIA
jgi:hypothetical protein